MRASDFFAGLGGFTLGAELAGLRVELAANHWPAAVEWHERNHPETRHLCQDLGQLDMRELSPGGILLASPACQGFSSNGRPGRSTSSRAAVKHQADRNTSYAILAAADTARPEAIIVENVEDFLLWDLFGPWRAFLEAMGYHVREHVLRASSYGSPQERDRAVVTAALRGPIELEREPAPSSLTIGDCLEADAGGWVAIDSKVRPRAPKAGQMRDRMLAAQNVAGRRCVWANVDSSVGRPLDARFATITTKTIGQLYLLDGDRCRLFTPRELARAQSFPDTYELPEERTLAGKLIGNAIDCRLSEGVARQVLAAVA